MAPLIQLTFTGRSVTDVIRPHYTSRGRGRDVEPRLVGGSPCQGFTAQRFCFLASSARASAKRFSMDLKSAFTLGKSFCTLG